MSRNPDRIDVHHHLIPPIFAAAMATRGLTRVAGASLPAWTPEKSIETMDANGIATALLSVSSPGVYFGDRQEARDLARGCNEFAAETRARHPDRFGSFAILPMPITEDACREAIYALDELKADGVVLLGSVDGKFLGDACFDELMAELDRRSAVVFLHPNLHPTTSQIGLATPEFLVEFLCDTTRAAVNIILSGTAHTYPNIRWILAHAGGFLPYIAWRLSLANGFPKIAIKAPKGVLHYIRSFYYDTALSPSPYAMAALLQLVEPDHILFGSDYPFAPAVVTSLQTKDIDELELFDDAMRSRVNRENALALFPRLGGVAGPPHGRTGALKKLARAPVTAIVGKIRNR